MAEDGSVADLVVVYGDSEVSDFYDITVPSDSVEILVGGTLDPFSNVPFTVSPGESTDKGLYETYTATNGETFLVPKQSFVEVQKD